MDLLFSYGNTGAMRLLRDIHPLVTWDGTDFRSDWSRIASYPAIITSREVIIAGALTFKMAA